LRDPQWRTLTQPHSLDSSPLSVLLARGSFASRLSRQIRRWLEKTISAGALKPLENEKAFRAFLRPLFQQEWVVYAKPPFAGPHHVLAYLAAYTHRVAISNHRLLAFQNDQVTFLWKDYAHGSKKKRMTLSSQEFLRRFLLHVLPRAFVRIRFSGFLANCRRANLLPLCQKLLSENPPPNTVPAWQFSALQPACFRCPRCAYPMMLVERFPASTFSSLIRSSTLDSS
jgi:hypothetical protein